MSRLLPGEVQELPRRRRPREPNHLLRFAAAAVLAALVVIGWAWFNTVVLG